MEENTVGMEVLRVKAIDMDLSYTDNWLAVFEIVSGNEGGYFNITTDPKTNEGIITITKVKSVLFFNKHEFYTIKRQNTNESCFVLYSTGPRLRGNKFTQFGREGCQQGRVQLWLWVNDRGCWWCRQIISHQNKCHQSEGGSPFPAKRKSGDCL